MTETTANDEGFAALADQAREDKQAQQEAISEAEKTKRKIMRERGEVDPDAPPLYISHDGHEFKFRPMPKKVNIWIENTMLDYLGLTEDEIEDNPEVARSFREVKSKTIDTLTEYSVADTFDKEFWSDWVGYEERMELIGKIKQRQDEREGNRQ